MRKEIGRYPIIFVGLIAGLLLMPIWASAVILDTTSFDLGTGNDKISGYPGPYAHVVVDLNTTHTATITFTSLTATQGSNNYIYLFGDGSSVDVNVNADSWTLGPITWSQAGMTGFAAASFSDGGAGNVNGFGVFNQTINNDDGFKQAVDEVSFTLTDNDVAGWANALSVLIANDHEAVAAAHIFVASDPAIQSNGALATGFASGNEEGGPPPFETPEPSTIILIGAGLLGFGFHGRKRMQK